MSLEQTDYVSAINKDSISPIKAENTKTLFSTDFQIQKKIDMYTHCPPLFRENVPFQVEVTVRSLLSSTTSGRQHTSVHTSSTAINTIIKTLFSS